MSDCVAEDYSPPFGFGTNFLNFAEKACVHDCNTEDNNHILNYARTKCVEKCDTGYFFESEGLLNTSLSYVPSCQKCNEMKVAQNKLDYCATCSSLDICLTCQAGYFLKSDNTKCVANCNTGDAGKARDSSGVKCVSTCPPGEYFDASDVTNTDNFCKSSCTPLVTYYDIATDTCKSCSGIADCAECSAGKCTKCLTTYTCLSTGTCLASCSTCTGYLKSGPDKVCTDDCHLHNILYFE